MRLLNLNAFWFAEYPIAKERYDEFRAMCRDIEWKLLVDRTDRAEAK